MTTPTFWTVSLLDGLIIKRRTGTSMPPGAVHPISRTRRESRLCPVDKSGGGATPSQDGRVVLRPWHVLLRLGDLPLEGTSKAYQLFPVCFCVLY